MDRRKKRIISEEKKNRQCKINEKNDWIVTGHLSGLNGRNQA